MGPGKWKLSSGDLDQELSPDQAFRTPSERLDTITWFQLSDCGILIVTAPTDPRGA